MTEQELVAHYQAANPTLDPSIIVAMVDSLANIAEKWFPTQAAAIEAVRKVLDVLLPIILPLIPLKPAPGPTPPPGPLPTP